MINQLLSHTFLGVTPQEIGNTACTTAGSGALGCGGTGLLAAGGFVNNTINTVIMIIAALSVIMIIVGGLRYTLSGGDAAGLKGAKDTILYSLVGLAVSLLSFTLVSFVISRLG